MKIQLIQGHFSAADAIDIVTRMVHAKIKFHEDKIYDDSGEETIKMRETRIKQLQKDLFDLRRQIESTKGMIDIQADMTVA